MAAVRIPNFPNVPNLAGNRLAIGYMLLAVTLFSSLPLVIERGGGGQTPFLFNAGMNAGVALGCLVFIVILYRRLVFNPAILLEVARRAKDVNLALSVVATFNFALFAWSTRLIDVSVAAILFETWPILLILLMTRLFPGGARYREPAPEMLFLLVLSLAGFAFVVVGQAGGFANIQTGGLSALIVGVILAVAGAVATSFTAFSFRWGTDVARAIAREIPREAREGFGDHSLEMFGVLVAFFIANTVAAVLNGYAGMNTGEAMDSRTLLTAVVLGAAINGIANVAWRKANLITDNLGINALANTTPVFSLVWLFLFFQVAPERPDYLVIGVVGIITVNLLINSEAEIRFGFKALLLGLWACGAFVYLRDDVLQYLPFGEWQWPGETYFGALGLSATVFTLLRSFRVARLSTQTQDEDNRLYSMFQNLDLLARRNVIDAAVREHILAIDAAVTPEGLQKAYGKIRGCLANAVAANPSPEDRSDLAEAETQLNVIAHSRQQGIEFGELFALIIFGGITILIGLASRPGVTGWIGFLVEMLVVLFSAVIVFLIVNVWDLHRDRAGEILERRLYTHNAGNGLTRYYYYGYGVKFLDPVNRRFEQTASVVIGLLVTAAFAALLWQKWMP